MPQAGPVKQVYQFNASCNRYQNGKVMEEARTDCNTKKQDIDYEEINYEFGITLSCNCGLLVPVDQIETDASRDKVDKNYNINCPYHRSVPV